MTVTIPSLQLRLPLPPSINAQYATVNGRRVLTKDARAFKKQVDQQIELLRFEGSIGPAFLAALCEGYLSLFIDFYFETPMRRDLDGGLKITLDALCQALGVDDRRVVDVHLVKKIDPLQPHIDVQLEILPDWQFDRAYTLLSESDI